MSQMPLAGEIPDWTLGWRMRRALDHAGISVQQMADFLGLSRSQLSLYLNDKAPVRRVVLRDWARTTGVSYAWLVTGDASDPEPDGPGAVVLYPPWDSNPEPAD